MPTQANENVEFYYSGRRVSLTNSEDPVVEPSALLQIVNDGTDTCALRTTSYWTGTNGQSFSNNDNSLWEVFNNVLGNSTNRSWAGSFGNAYNNIPAGVTDAGERTAVIGWAVSALSPGYLHAGTLDQQLGLYGVAGFQGAGSAPTAVTNNAIGVRGYIYADSVGATIRNAYAGQFISSIVPGTGVVENNYAIYAGAGGGANVNFSFYGNGGKFFNLDQALFGNVASQSGAAVCARAPSNALEFGNPDPAGYGSSIGATASSGYPFVAFCGEAAGGNNFRTRGKAGTVILNDLAGSLIFGRLSNASSTSQPVAESGRFDANGQLALAERPILPGKPPASATAPGKAGEMTWDGNFIYLCVAADTWKRAALSAW